MKVCTECNEEKPLTEFHKSSKGKWKGHQSKCKPCQADITRARRKADPNITLKMICRKYGITPKDYNRMFAEQDGCCSICGTHQIEFKRRLSIEHNHDTGEVRSLACQPCNWMVGWCKEDRDRLKLVDKYLEKHN